MLLINQKTKYEKNTTSSPLLLSNVFFAQNTIPNWSWAKNINLFSNSKQNMTTVDNDGNVYLITDFIESEVYLDGVTFTNTSQDGFSDALLLKFNGVTGDLMWYTQITGSSFSGITSIDADAVGNVYLSGSFVGTATIANVTLNSSYNNAFIAKLDSSGNCVWAISNTGSNEVFSATDVKVDVLGNVFLAGYVNTASLTFGDVVMDVGSESEVANNIKPFLAKFDEAGTCLWGKIGSSDTNNPMGSIVLSISPDNNGGVSIAGRFGHNNITFDDVTVVKSTQNNNTTNVFLFKFDNNGVANWGFSTGSPYVNSSIGNSTVIDSEGNVYLGGIFTNSAQFGDITLQTSSGSKMFISKFQADGTVLWAKSANYSDGYTSSKSMDVDNNDNLYVAGLNYASTIYFNNDVILTNLGDDGAFFVAKYNSAGTPLWAKGVSNLDANNKISIACKAEDDIMVGGTFDENELLLGPIVLNKNASNVDAFVARLYNESLSTSSFNSVDISVYPNPVSENLYISNLTSDYTYSLFNMLGKQVKNGTISIGNNVVNLEAIQSGMYIMTFTDNQGKVSQKKIMVK